MDQIDRPAVRTASPGDVIVAVLVLCGVSTACEDVTTVAPAVAEVRVNLSSPELSVGAIDTISVTLLGADGRELEGRRVVWSTSDPGVVEVSGIGDGMTAAISTRGAGRAEITAEADRVRGHESLTVVNEPPLVGITSPVTGASYLPGELIRLAGFANDAEEGALPEGALSWISRLDGELGLGRSVERSDLSVGEHWIVLEARDSYDGVGADSVWIVVPDPQGWTSLAVGRAHACGLRDGRAYCWGDNESGQLGDGTNAARNTPVAVVADTTFIAITAGGGHSCGIAEEGPVYCWGRNDHGQLGDGTNSGSNTPVAVSSLMAGTGQEPRVTAGTGHTCGSPRGGTLYCWGWNQYGQLGNGSTLDANVPVQVSGFRSLPVISGGTGHTCGAGRDEAYCWGWNAYGQLGDRSSTNRNAPMRVSADLAYRLISAGARHTCAVVTDGMAYCWGGNDRGQLGDGSRMSRSSPVRIDGSLEYWTISAGDTHSCGVTVGGMAYCWGSNAHGQLGDGTINDSGRPAAVAGGITFWEIAASFDFTCGRTPAGAAYCWGRNDSGQLGDGTNMERLIPTRVEDPPGI